jgi:pyruvate ferredoxin oxidoreductase alpha subunit
MLSRMPMQLLCNKNISINTNEGASTETSPASITVISMPVMGYTVGHGGRDIRAQSIERLKRPRKLQIRITVESRFLDLKEELL